MRWMTVAAAVLWASEAGAQSRAVGKPEVFAEAAVAAALASHDREKLAWGLGEVRRAGVQGAGQAGAVEGLLKRGLPVDLARQAIEALGATRQAARAGVLRPYVRHRAVEIRLATMEALGRLRGGALLIKALEDEDDGVRAQAATALGRACEGKQCEALVALVGVIPLSILGLGLAEVWAREDASDEIKGKVMERLAASEDPVAAEVVRRAKELRAKVEARRERREQRRQQRR